MFLTLLVAACGGGSSNNASEGTESGSTDSDGSADGGAITINDPPGSGSTDSEGNQDNANTMCSPIKFEYRISPAANTDEYVITEGADFDFLKSDDSFENPISGTIKLVSDNANAVGMGTFETDISHAGSVSNFTLSMFQETESEGDNSPLRAALRTDFRVHIYVREGYEFSTSLTSTINIAGQEGGPAVYHAGGNYQYATGNGIIQAESLYTSDSVSSVEREYVRTFNDGEGFTRETDEDCGEFVNVHRYGAYLIASSNIRTGNASASIGNVDVITVTATPVN